MIDREVCVMIAAAGMGKRMNIKQNKQYLPIHGKPMVRHTIEIFDGMEEISFIVLLIREGEESMMGEILASMDLSHSIYLVVGGDERQDTIWKGLQFLKNWDGIILTHDGARPFVTKEEVRAVIVGAGESGACCLMTPMKDTVKISEGSKVKVKAFPQTGGNAPYQAVSVDVVSTELSGAGLIDELKYDEMKIAYSTNKDATVDGNFKAEKTDVFKLNKDTAITVLGKKAELRSLSTRDMVVFKAQDGVLKELEVFPNKGTVSGEFVNYEYNRFGNSRIVLKLDNKKEQAFIVKE